MALCAPVSSKPVSGEFAREWQFNGLATTRPSDFPEPDLGELTKRTRYPLSFSMSSNRDSRAVQSQSLLWQTDSTNQFGKARVGVESIQTCVGRKVFRQYVRALLVGTIEPGERLIFFP